MNENSGGTPSPLNPTPEQALSSNQATPEPIKKKKTGLIVGIIIGAVALIGGAVAAVLLLPGLLNQNPVATAMQRIMSGATPKNVAIDGEFNILINQEDSPIKRVNVNLDSDIVTGSMINTSSAVLTFTTSENKDFSVKFNEIYAADGNVYFKIDGATAALEDSGLLGTGVTSSDTLDVVESIDGTWLRVSAEMIQSMSDGSTQESPISCVTDLVTDLNKTNNTAAELYNKYPFITSTTENVFIPSKHSQVYQVGLDSKNLTSFINSITNSNLVGKVYTCLGYEDSVSVSEEDIKTIVDKMPKVFVELNGQNDFSRLYMESNLNDGAASLIIDLGFSYPTNVTVTEPVEYTDFTDVINQLMSGFYMLPDTDSDLVEIDTDWGDWDEDWYEVDSDEDW